MSKYTELETTVLSALYDIAIDAPPLLDDVVGETGLDSKTLRGVITSLNKKGMVKVVEVASDCTWYVVENCDWPCDHYSDEEWDALKTKALGE